jgi:hypothetical protein
MWVNPNSSGNMHSVGKSWRVGKDPPHWGKEEKGMTGETLKGRCLCGEVAWEMTGPFDFLGMCQCSLCRKVTGSAFATNLFANLDQFSWISGEENRIEYQMPAPKKFGNAVCKSCGSRVPKVSGAGGRVLIPLGSTMGSPGIEPTLVCVEDHAEWFAGLEEAISGKKQ